jgi:tetratricopeptide (TPR) repeat protein
MSVSFRPPFCRLACAILESMRIAVLLLLLSSALASAQQANPDQLFGSAIEAQQRGDYPTAIEDYQKLLKLRPKMVEARVNLGAALAHTGRFDEAIKEYQLALPDVPDKDSVHMNIGLAYYKKGDLADAIGEFKIVQKSRPLDPQLAILLGDSEVRSGKGADAVAMLTPLEAENAGNPDFEYVMGTALVAAGNRRDGVARLEKVAQTTNSADAYFLAGSTYMYLNEFEHARKDLEAALALNPKLPRINTLVGMARDRTGDPDAAEPAFRAALAIDPNDFDANLYLGAELLKKRSVDEAKPYLDKAIALNPSSTMARYEEGMWQSNSGKYEEAAKDLEEVEKEDPSWLEPHVELATVYYRLHRPADGAKERAIVDKLTAEQQTQMPRKQ